MAIPNSYYQAPLPQALEDRIFEKMFLWRKKEEDKQKGKHGSKRLFVSICTSLVSPVLSQAVMNFVMIELG